MGLKSLFIFCAHRRNRMQFDNRRFGVLQNEMRKIHPKPSTKRINCVLCAGCDVWSFAIFISFGRRISVYTLWAISVAAQRPVPFYSVHIFVSRSETSLFVGIVCSAARCSLLVRCALIVSINQSCVRFEKWINQMVFGTLHIDIEMDEWNASRHSLD